MLDKKPLFIFLVLLLLSACGSDHVKDENSAFYSVPVGSQLVLNQDVTIDADQVAIYVQNGQLLSYDDVDKYQPNCKFEVYKISSSPRTVLADSFEIIKVEDNIESSSIQDKTRLASLHDRKWGINISMGGLDHSEVFNYATIMYLSSASQKDVYRMTCQYWESVLVDRYLSIAQMRMAMGEIFTLKIKQ